VKVPNKSNVSHHDFLFLIEINISSFKKIPCLGLPGTMGTYPIKTKFDFEVF
jgi:hypothetical protein